MKLFGEVLLLSESISLWMAIVTTVAVIWALLQPFVIHGMADRRTRREEQKEEIAVLVTMHQHFVICCHMIQFAWEKCLPNLAVPIFGLPTFGIDKIFKMAALRLRDDPEILRTILDTYEDHHQLNAGWSTVKTISADPQRQKGFRSTLVSLKEKTQPMYHDTWNCLRQIENRLRKIAPNIPLKEDSNSLPSELDPFREKPGVPYPWNEGT